MKKRKKERKEGREKRKGKKKRNKDGRHRIPRGYRSVGTLEGERGVKLIGQLHRAHPLTRGLAARTMGEKRSQGRREGL